MIERIKKRIEKRKKLKSVSYWKNKYYKTLREKNDIENRNDVLSEDLRNTYARSKHYENLYLDIKKKV